METLNKIDQKSQEFSPRKTLIPISMKILEDIFRLQAERDKSGDLPVLMDFTAGIIGNIMTLDTHYTVYEDKQELNIRGSIVRKDSKLVDYLGIIVEPPKLRQAVIEAYGNNSSTTHFIESTIEAAYENKTQVRCVDFKGDKLVLEFSFKI